MHNAKLLYTVSFGLLAGMLLALLFNIAPLGAFFILCVNIVFLIWWAVKPTSTQLLCMCFTGFIVLGVIRVELFNRQGGDAPLTSYVGEVSALSGVVVSDPEEREYTTHARVAVDTIEGDKVSLVVLAKLPPRTHLLYGEKVVLKGTLEAPESFVTNTGHVFDYPAYLEVRGVALLLARARVVSVEPAPFSLQSFLFSLKHSFERALEKVFPEPSVSLLEGILLGEKRGMSEALSNAFIFSGLIHVVVLSGHNISVVAESVLRLFSFLPRVFGFSLSAVTIVLFALMTGGGAATVRACIMAVIAIIARYTHRSSVAMRALVVAGVGMVLWNPLSLTHDPSFMLSMLATFGLITLSPIVERSLPSFVQRSKNLPSIIASTVAVQLFVLPALLYMTGVLSPYALPANILALPVVPLVMFFGFVSGLLVFVHPWLAWLPALITQILLWWMLFVAEHISQLPFAQTSIPEFSLFVVILLYVPLTLGALYAYNKTDSV